MKIHFINVGSGDAILLESKGQFALIDGGEDTYNFKTKGHTDVGYQDKVKDYIKAVTKNYRDKNGKIVLNFIIGTHAHSDHIGGLREVVKDPNFIITKAYLKEYPNSYWNNLNDSEKSWDNKEQYEDIIYQLGVKGADVLKTQNDLDSIKRLGDFEIQLFNTKVFNSKNGENENSLVTTVKANGKIVLLTGDLNELHDSLKETAVLKELQSKGIKKVNLLKLGHHGYINSNTQQFLKGINPDYVIATNNWSHVYGATKDLLFSMKKPTYAVGDNDGIILDFSYSNFNLSKYKLSYVWTKVGSYWYYKTTNASILYEGWFQDPDNGNWYYLRKSTNDRIPGPKGAMITGWFEDTTRRWYYMRIKDNDKSNGAEGSMVKGWMKDGNYWYYLRPQKTGNEPEGSMATGWIQPDGKWYYLRLQPEGNIPGGTMVTGTRVIDGKTYIFNSDGSLKS